MAKNPQITEINSLITIRIHINKTNLTNSYHSHSQLQATNLYNGSNHNTSQIDLNTSSHNRITKQHNMPRLSHFAYKFLSDNDDDFLAEALDKYEDETAGYFYSRMREGEIHTDKMNTSYYCYNCVFRTGSFINWFKHMEEQHIHMIIRNYLQYNKLQCDICARSFTNIREAWRHRCTNHVDRTYECDNCLYSSSCAAEIIQHIKTCIIPVEPCTECQSKSCMCP